MDSQPSPFKIKQSHVVDEGLKLRNVKNLLSSPQPRDAVQEPEGARRATARTERASGARWEHAANQWHKFRGDSVLTFQSSRVGY